MVCKKRIVYEGRHNMDHKSDNSKEDGVKTSVLRLMTRPTFCRSVLIAGW
jgi:hypothetical protein